MATLMDVIRGNNNALAGTQAAASDQTTQVQNLLRAKTGKALGDAAGSASNLGEQAAVSDTQAQLQAQAPQVAAQGQAMDVAARRQQLDTQSQQATIDQARKFDTAENQMKTQQLMSGLARDKDTLDLDKDKSRLEQASFLLSMQDKKYVNDLQDIGKKQRLDDAAQFKAKQEQLAFGSSLDLVKQKLGNADILSASSEDFKKAMSDMSIDQAMQVAALEIQDIKVNAGLGQSQMQTEAQQKSALSGIQAQSQGLQDLVKAGTAGYTAYANAPKTPTPTPTTPPAA